MVGCERGSRGKGQRKEGKDREDWLLCNRCTRDTLTMPGQERINVATHTEARDNAIPHGPLGERKKMRKLSHFAQPSFLFASVFHSEHPRPREHRGAEAGHARSSAGYYFSRRIFPQMNFMKTVFALLINRCFVAGPSPRPPSVPTLPPVGLAFSSPLWRRPASTTLFVIPSTHVDHRAPRKAFNNNIVSRTARGPRRVRSSLLITLNGWNTIFGQLPSAIHRVAFSSVLLSVLRVSVEKYNQTGY